MRMGIQEYIAAFHKCYPSKEIKVLYRRQHDKYAVKINGENSDRLLSFQELLEATKMFLS
jgi:hypothetical protein